MKKAKKTQKTKIRGKAASRSTTKKPKLLPLKNKDLPVSQGQFQEFRSEMGQNFTSVHLEFKVVRNEMSAMENRIEARFAKIDQRFAQVDQRFATFDERFAQIDERFARIDERFDRLEARVNELDAKIETLIGMFHQMRMLIEEQNNRNKFVLDGFANLLFRMEENKKETDARLTRLEEMLSSVKSGNA